MLDRFSDRARSAVELAELEARRLGHHHIGTEHLLLGLISEGDSAEAQSIRAAGVTLDAAREKVAEAVGTKRDAVEKPAGELEYTARARRALERASRFSLQRLDEHVEIEHLLLGVLDVEGTACQVLRRLGADLGALRRAVDQVPIVVPEEEDSGPRGRSPECPKCGEILATVLAHRVLTAFDEAGTSRDFVVAFCSGCGTAIGATLA
jgi:ATP-dependent Clp protease ATP-binding subunit ClpC